MGNAPPSLRVLIVEGDVVLAQAAAQILRRHACMVEAARAARDALARLHTWRPDIVVLDVQRDDDENRELLRALQAGTPGAAPHLVVCTDDCAPMVSRIGLRLARPLRVGSLVNAVRALAVVR